MTSEEECFHENVERVEEIRVGDVVVYHVEWCPDCESALGELHRRVSPAEAKRLRESHAVLRV